MWIAPTAPAAGPGQRGADRHVARARNRHQPAGRLVDAERGLRRGLRHAVLEVAEIAVDDRLQIGVQHRGGEPLVFAEFRLHLRRDRQVHVRIGGLQRVADHRLVRGVEEREQQAHRAGIGLRLADRLHQRRQRVGRKRADRLAVGGDALGRLEAQFARHQRRRVVVLQAEHMRADLPADLDQVAEALGDDERDLAAAPLDQRIRRDGRAVREPRDRRQLDAVAGRKLAQAGNHRQGRVGRRRGHLVQDDAVGRVVEREKVREGAADIDTDHPGHLAARATDTVFRCRGDLAGCGGRDQSTCGCRIGALRDDCVCATMRHGGNA